MFRVFFGALFFSDQEVVKMVIEVVEKSIDWNKSANG